MMIGFFYCPSEDCTCPYYNCKTGKCKLGKSALRECDDAYAAMGDDDEDYTSPFTEPWAVYDPDPI